MSARKGKSGGTCEFCGNTYSKREHYQRHVRTHTRERPFCCTECTATFSRKDTLSRHVRARHPGVDPSQISEITLIDSPRDDSPHLQDPLQAHQSTSLPANISTSSNDGFAQDSFPQDLIFGSCAAGSFDWSWDDSLNLDPSFSWEDLGTYDLNIASPSIPWLPLRSEPEPPRQTRRTDTLLSSARMSQHWFSSMSRVQQPAVSAWDMSDASATAGDEISRDALADSLQQRVPDTNLPSIQFLNRCLHIFTTRLWPLVPIVHLPTFQPARTNPLLLLSICSLGALAIGSEESLSHGERLFDGVQKAILVSFSPNRFQDEHSLAILQAATIGQTYALLSGSASNLLTAQCFHGTLGVAVRAFHSKATMTAPEQSFDDWSSWIQYQTTLRLLNLIYVHNGEVFATVHQPPLLRTHPLQIRLASDDSLYLAKTASEWATLKERFQPSASVPCSLFSSCAVLDCFVAEIYHRKSAPFNKVDVAADEEFHETLVTWFDQSTRMLGTMSAQKSALLMLWHSCFILLLCDVDLMERVCGRDGANEAEDETRLLQVWTSTGNARRCTVHALLIYTLLERLRVSDVPAMHVGRVTWQAGLVLAVFSFFAQTQPSGFTDSLTTCPELQAVRKTSLYSESEWASVEQTATPERCRMTAFSLSAMLRHLGPWQNSARYAKTLDQVLQLLELH